MKARNKLLKLQGTRVDDDAQPAGARTPDAPCVALAAAEVAVELRADALAALRIAEPTAKVDAVRALAAAAPAAAPNARFVEPPDVPGRPPRPRLVAADQVPRRPVGTIAGRAALLHALAHIEFNAVNLALDAVWRFDDLPVAYYSDWLRVAAEEAHHFTLLQQRLMAHGAAYGDFDAHDGLWEMARRTAHDALARMALVPRTLEARGLDASPAIRARLAAAGDAESAAVLDVVLRDEIGHVAIGNRWFRHLAAARGVSPHAAYADLAAAHGAPRLRGPFNLAARRAAGFDEAELAALDG